MDDLLRITLLPSLRSIRICINEDYAENLVEVSHWELPALEHVHFRSSQHISNRALVMFLQKHGQHLKSLSLDSSTSSDVQLWNMLSLCGPDLQELVCFDTTRSPPPTFQFHPIKTVAVNVRDMSEPFTLSRTILGSLQRINWINNQTFPSLECLVVVSPRFDVMKAPHQPDLQLYQNSLSDVIKPWRDAGIRVLNRSGVAVFPPGGWDHHSMVAPLD